MNDYQKNDYMLCIYVSITYPSYMAIDSDSGAGTGWRDGLKEKRK